MMGSKQRFVHDAAVDVDDDYLIMFIQVQLSTAWMPTKEKFYLRST